MCSHKTPKPKYIYVITHLSVCGTVAVSIRTLPHLWHSNNNDSSNIFMHANFFNQQWLPRAHVLSWGNKECLSVILCGVRPLPSVYRAALKYHKLQHTCCGAEEADYLPRTHSHSIVPHPLSLWLILFCFGVSSFQATLYIHWNQCHPRLSRVGECGRVIGASHVSSAESISLIRCPQTSVVALALLLLLLPSLLPIKGSVFKYFSKNRSQPHLSPERFLSK